MDERAEFEAYQAWWRERNPLKQPSSIAWQSWQAAWQARAALASSPSQPADDYMLIRRDVVQFLRGDASLTGYWFNDDRPAHPRFWWRKYLPSLDAAPALGEGER